MKNDRVGEAAALAAELRRAWRGMDVLYHGTRSCGAILAEDRLRRSPSGEIAVSFTRSPDVAAYWATLERGEDGQESGVIVVDRRRLAARYRIEPFHDAVWDGLGGCDEREERVTACDVSGLSAVLAGVHRMARRGRPAYISVIQKREGSIMQDAVYRVTEEQAVRWAMSFGDTEAPGAREMTQAQLHEVARQAAARQVADDPTADCVDSGVILQTIHDAGFAGAFEPEVETLAEEMFRDLREAAAGMRA